MVHEKVVVGIDIGGTKTLVGIVDSTGAVLVKQQYPTNIDDDPEVHLQKCIQMVKECLAKIGMQSNSLLGIGVNVPGLANPNQGILLHAPYLGWRNVQVKAILEKEWSGLPIKIANDVNSCAMGELVFGKGKELNHFLWITISTGIGGGVIIDRKIYEGQSMIAGEIGHLVVEWENGNLCGCGNEGCLEAHGSGTAIAYQAEKMITSEQSDITLARYFQDNDLEITAQNVATAARAGIKPAQEIYEQAGEYIGRALSYVANILNPEAIFIGGGVSLSFDLLEPQIRKVFQSAVIDDSNAKLPILLTGLGYEAALIGAASLIYTNLNEFE